MTRLLKEGWIAAYLKYTSEQESPPNFHFYTALSVLGGALRRNTWFDRTYYVLYPNLYVILVAGSAECRKSVASSIGVRILRHVDGIRVFRGKASVEGLLDFMLESQPHQVGTRIVTDNSVYIYASELSMFLSKATYTSEMIPMFLDFSAGEENSIFKTRTGGEYTIPKPLPSLFAASTPDQLKDCLSYGSFSSGFAGRVLFVYETEARRIAWTDHSPEMKELEKKLINDLQHISQLYGAFSITEEAREFFKNWYENPIQSKIEDPRLSGYYGRKHDFVFKLAMILAVSRSDELVIQKTHLQLAMNTLNSLELKMLGAFQYVGTNSAALAEDILTIITGNKGVILHSLLLSKLRGRVNTLQEFQDCLKGLKEMKQIKMKVISGQSYYILWDQSEETMQEAIKVTAVEEVKKKERFEEIKKVAEAGFNLGTLYIPGSPEGKKESVSFAPWFSVVDKEKGGKEEEEKRNGVSGYKVGKANAQQIVAQIQQKNRISHSSSEDEE